MALAWSRRAAAGVLLVACGCAGGGHGVPPPSGGGLDASPPLLASLKFDVDPGLECADDAGAPGICVAPSQVVTFGIEGPPGTIVSLSLEGNYADAALTTGQVTLTGTATNVTLECSSTTAAFTVVALAGGQAVPLRVKVATSGNATVQATPNYGGRRPTPEYFATKFSLSTCAELTSNAPDASASPWTAGPAGVAIALSVPAGERVAVQMRIGHYAFGCADVDPLVPDATVALTVQVYDIPMALSLTNLAASLSFDFDPTGDAWASVSGAALARVEGAFFGVPSSDAATLLDAMRVAILIPAGQMQFDQLRQAQGWDAATTAWLATPSHHPTIGNRAATWLNAAAGDAVGPLVLQIGNATGTGTAPVAATSLGPLSWVAAGLTQPAPFQWTADANDTVHVSGAIDFASTPLFAHDADRKAAGAVKGSFDCPSAIALGIDCVGLGSKLVGTGVSYGNCDATCTGNLCASALAAVWKAAAAPASGGADAVHATITASAPATVGDLAEPAYVTGGWIGNMSGAGVPTPFTVKGTLVATETPAPAPP